MSSNSFVSRRLEGKVAIVTGGASGIGATTAALFHRHGAKVVIADIQDDLGRDLAANLSQNDDVLYIHCDVTDEGQVQTLIDTTVSKFGHLDVMFSNAGIISSARSKSNIVDTDKDELERILSVNLVGAVVAAKHAATAMIPTKKGCLIFTASACTEIAGISDHGYAASKYGIVGLTKSLAMELGFHGIRVNCVSPFGVLTGSNANDEVMRSVFESLMSEAGNLKGKVLKAEDIANAVVYLASDEASYVSGVNLVVDGGYSVVNPSLAMASKKVGF